MANSTIADLECWLRRGGKSVRLNLPPKSQAQLLRLQVWSIRYYLSVTEILDLIMPVLLSQIHRPKRSHGLGVSVGLLISDKTEHILQVEINRRYRELEHIKIAKTQEQERQLRAEQIEELEGLPAREHYMGTIAVDMDGPISRSIDKFVVGYTQHALAKRSSYQTQLHAKWRTRKAYRNNPWV